MTPAPPGGGLPLPPQEAPPANGGRLVPSAADEAMRPWDPPTEEHLTGEVVQAIEPDAMPAEPLAAGPNGPAGAGSSTAAGAGPAGPGSGAGGDADADAGSGGAGGGGWLAPVRRVPGGRTTVWALVAVLCALAGTVGALLGARALARNDASKARLDFHLSSAGIASTIRLAIVHEEDFAVSAAAFFAGNPHATPAQFAAWARSVHALQRYPELAKLNLVALVPAQDLAAFEARVSGHAAKAGTSASTAAAHATFPLIPGGARPYYCLSVAGLARNPGAASPRGLDYCALSRRLALAHATGQTSYTAGGSNKVLDVVTPVFAGEAPPAAVAARIGAFVGWLREVLVPSVVLQRALSGHGEEAVRLRYHSGSSHVVFTSGAPKPGAQTTAMSLHGGWSLRTFGPPVSAGILAHADALAVAIGGTVLSVLLGLVIFVLGTGRERALALAAQLRKQPREDLYDPLTKLPNRALMLDRAERMLARAGRQPGLLAGALFIDIDGFKEVNDKLGEAAGDQLLMIVSQRLQNVARTQDTVGRLGGDEFVILVEATARGARLDSLARRVIEALHQPVQLREVEPRFFLTASIGVAFGRYVTPEDLLRDAHLALYAAKAAGKDRYTLFNANMRSVIEGRAVLEVEMNTALMEKQFFLLYQPVFDLASQQIVGLEALIRWQHPAQGVLTPADFVPLAEETGLIMPIGRWVLEEACSRAAAWNVSGHQVGIAVKVSPYQLIRDGFVTDVRRALQQSGLDPSLLTLEIAETAVMRDIVAAAERLQRLKKLGVRIAIDDFGSGYAYQAHLQRLPLDFLKVDRASLAATDAEDYRSALLEASLGVGRDLALTVIAKGIESYEQMATLQALGCQLAQGFFLGAPTPLDSVEDLFHADFPGSPTPTRLFN
jgi:diguanylate cyclase (GGDEF)-like protein